MILSQQEIRSAIENGEIEIDPFPDDIQWNGASVDLRLGYRFTELRRVPRVGLRRGLTNLASEEAFWIRKNLKTENSDKKTNYILDPDEFVLALTLERIRVPRGLIAMVEGRSSYARVGLSMHQTAPWIQPGWNGQITLEIRNSGPWSVELVPEEDRPCQLTFIRLTSPVKESDTYGARKGAQFQDQTDALPKGRK